jgi:acetoacetyl-CoA synthetase
MCSPPGGSPLVLLKEGEGPPIVIAHGLAGTVQVSKLAACIDAPNPVYGIQAKGVDGAEEPLDRVEDMAGYYIEALQGSCPHGPYIVIGYSFGGLVALEMAQRLHDSSEILLLIMLDAYPHPQFLRLAARARLFVRRMTTHAQQMWQMPVRNGWTYFWKGVKRRLHLAPRSEPAPVSGSAQERTLYRVSEKAYEAYTHYQPRFYRGKVSFVTTRTKTFFPANPATAWKHLVADLEVEVVPGDHLNIVTTEFVSLAALLTRYVQKADGHIPRLKEWPGASL